MTSATKNNEFDNAFEQLSVLGIKKQLDPASIPDAKGPEVFPKKWTVKLVKTRGMSFGDLLCGEQEAVGSGKIQNHKAGPPLSDGERALYERLLEAKDRGIELLRKYYRCEASIESSSRKSAQEAGKRFAGYPPPPKKTALG